MRRDGFGAALALRFVIALAIVSVLAGAAIAGAYWDTNRQIDSIERVDVTGLDPGDDVPAEAGNFVIIGSDSRESGAPLNPGDEGQFGTELSDTLMVAHVDPETRTGLLVAFPRDLWVEIPGYGSNKINAAFSLGGPQRVIDTLEANFGIAVNHYLEVDFAGFQGIVDAVGEVPVYFPSSARDEQTGFSQPFGPGCVPLNGEQALAYVRSRQYEILGADGWTLDPGGDLGRIDRQQDFMRRLASVALKDVGANPLEARALADEVLGHLTVDEALGTRDVLGFVDTFRVVDPFSDAFESVAVPTESGTEYDPGTGIDLAVQYAVQPATDELLARLREFGQAPAEAPSSTTTTQVGTPEPTQPGVPSHEPPEPRSEC